MRYSGIVPALAVLTPKIRLIIGPLFWPDSHRLILPFKYSSALSPSSAIYYHFKLIELWYHNVDYVLLHSEKKIHRIFESALFYYFLDSSTISYSKSFSGSQGKRFFFVLSDSRKKSAKKLQLFFTGRKKGPQEIKKKNLQLGPIDNQECFQHKPPVVSVKLQ